MELSSAAARQQRQRLPFHQIPQGVQDERLSNARFEFPSAKKSIGV